jgi:SAM-dependent methyltransferase
LHWLVQPLADGLVLNLGAGPTAPVRPRTTFVGVDLVVPEPVPPPPFTVANALELPFARATFDGALCKDIVEHTLDPIGVLAEVHRVCRPGARLVVTVPRAIPRAVWADPTHIRGFTDGAIVQALRAAGWEVEGRPKRIGALPGAGRLGLEHRLVDIMRIPGLGHWFGTNWYVTAGRA